MTKNYYEQYIESEEDQTDYLQTTLSKMQNAWFKTNKVNKEMQFLEWYIKKKQSLIDEMKRFYTLNR